MTKKTLKCDFCNNFYTISIGEYNKKLSISQQRNGCYRLIYQAGTAKKVLDWLYKDSTIYMDRKKLRWKEM